MGVLFLRKPIRNNYKISHLMFWLVFGVWVVIWVTGISEVERSGDGVNRGSR